MFNSLRTWWLALDCHWGAFHHCRRTARLQRQGLSPPDLARMVNRQYLVQLLEGSARYMLADDDFLSEDLEWAGFTFAQRTARGFRYRKVHLSLLMADQAREDRL